ncbi:MAG: GNAT family N-acetyltransferase [Tissierellaceae bacterium]
MKVEGKRIKIRPLELRDVYYMRNWGYHTNPLLGDYNFPLMTDNQIKKWYEIKTHSLFNKYFAVVNEDDILIGYMGIKDIKRIKRESTLGIVFDPNYIEQGYGTETLKYFLRYYFTEMKMRRMYLEVAEFNTRAYTVYRKMGFKPVAYYLDEFFDPNLDLNGIYYLDAKTTFVITDEKIYNYIYKMRLNKKEFLQRFSKI